MSQKLQTGKAFPTLTVPALDGGEITLGKPENGNDWQMVIVYRGIHCPVCTHYLHELNMQLDAFHAVGVDVVAVSADPREKAEAQTAVVNPRYRVGYDLSLEQMRTLGLYISEPRTPQESDRPYAEPGLFVINDQGTLQVVDISNAPYARPSLASMIRGLNFVRNPATAYPIRGRMA